MTSHQRPPSSPRGIQLSRSALSASGAGIAGGNKGIPEDSPVRCRHRCLCVADRLGGCGPRHHRSIGSRCLFRIHAGKPQAGTRYDGPVYTAHHHHRYRFTTEGSSNRITFGILDMFVGWVLPLISRKEPNGTNSFAAACLMRASQILHFPLTFPAALR